MTTKKQTTAEAFAELHRAAEDLKRALADTAPWRMLVRFADRHPLVARFAFQVLILGLSAYHLAADHLIEAVVYAAVALAAPWMLRR